MKRSTSLISALDQVTDPRRGEPVYPLVNILFMTICAVVAGADAYVAIAKFARTKKDWFGKFLDMSRGFHHCFLEETGRGAVLKNGSLKEFDSKYSISNKASVTRKQIVQAAIINFVINGVIAWLCFGLAVFWFGCVLVWLESYHCGAECSRCLVMGW